MQIRMGYAEDSQVSRFEDLGTARLGGSGGDRRGHEADPERGSRTVTPLRGDPCETVVGDRRVGREVDGCLVVGDGTDLSLPDTVTVTATDNQPPVAAATADITSGVVPLTVQFDSSGSFDPEGSPLQLL